MTLSAFFFRHSLVQCGPPHKKQSSPNFLSRALSLLPPRSASFWACDTSFTYGAFIEHRGQGYDGANNVKSGINGLKALIMNDTPSACYIHCFAHQLQLTLVVVAKDNVDCSSLLKQLGYLLNVIRVSCKLLVIIGNNASNKEDRAKAQVVLYSFESFDVVFTVHLMLFIFRYTSQLSYALQQKDQEIINVMTLKVTNMHRFRIEIFLSFIDLQLQELNNRFDEINMELLTCMASLNFVNSFAAFDKKKILKLAEFYPNEYFMQIEDLRGLSCMLVEKNKHNTHRDVYLLLKLVLIFSVTTTSVEKIFSAISLVKNKLRNSMGDQLSMIV
uniref:HAT C-terminal dimerisation domain-containing protein n=1 Tax=Kalanchoe fedtschenkoi TaxID=63787 RepID=A0A7N0UUG9_KALFE